MNNSHKQFLFINVVAYIFTVGEIFFPKILLILDNLISVGDVSSVMFFL